MDPTGAYTAERAAALSGVPRSTIHYWARKGVLAPAVSSERVKLWSYADLMAMRIIYWLRQRKTDADGAEIPPTGMLAVRRAIGHLERLDIPLWHSEGKSAIWVTGDGEIHIRGKRGAHTLDGQLVIADALNLVAPFETREGLRGPDLSSPRADLRIVPGRISGSPHVVGTRLETQTLYALDRDGLDSAAIRALYPYVNEEQLRQALDLESQLAENLAIRVAA